MIGEYEHDQSKSPDGFTSMQQSESLNSERGRVSFKPTVMVSVFASEVLAHVMSAPATKYSTNMASKVSCQAFQLSAKMLELSKFATTSTWRSRHATPLESVNCGAEHENRE